MKRVLFIAYHFPPLAPIGAMRPLGFCRYLEQYGWQPHVLTTGLDSVYPPMTLDTHLSGRLASDMPITRVPHPNPLWTLIQMRDQLRQTLRGENQPQSQRSDSVGVLESSHQSHQGNSHSTSPSTWTTCKDFVSDRLVFPDPQRFWFRPALKAGLRICREVRPDAIVATGSPWTSLLVGRAIAEHTRIPFIADFRDPWTAPNFHGHVLSPALLDKAKQLESKVCDTATRVIANTPELRAQLLADHAELAGLPDRCITITNGFDGKAIGIQSLRQDNQTNMQQPALELCHFGGVYGERNPFPLLQALQALATEQSLQSRQLRVRFVGSWDLADKNTQQLAQELEQYGLLQRDPPVSHSRSLQLMQRAPILLVLHPNAPFQIPAKLYEYIATQRPIVVIGGEGATAHLVEQKQFGRSCPNQTVEIKNLLAALLSGQLQLTPPAPANVARFDYQMLTGKLSEVLNAACEEKSRVETVSAASIEVRTNTVLS